MTAPRLQADTLSSARARANGVRFVETASGSSVATRIVGRGAPVVLVHGVTDNLATWHSLQHALEPEFETHAVDLPGHGLSDIPSTPPRLRHQAEWVLRYLDRAGIDRFVLVGNSMGGGVALGIAHLAPARVKSLVLLGSMGALFPAPFGLAMLRYPIIASQMPRVARNAKLRRLAIAGSFAPGFVPDEGVIERYWSPWTIEGRMPYTTALLRTIDVLEPWEWLPRITAPVRVVHGSRDQVIPVHVAHAIGARLPNAHTTILRGIGHMPQIECTDRVAEIVRGVA